MFCRFVIGGFVVHVTMSDLACLNRLQLLGTLPADLSFTILFDDLLGNILLDRSVINIF